MCLEAQAGTASPFAVAEAEAAVAAESLMVSTKVATSSKGSI